MMTTETQRLNLLTRGWRWAWKMGIALPVILGLVIALMAFITWASPRYRAPQQVDVGTAADYEVGFPIFFETERFWVSKLPTGEVIALYDRDPITGCTLPWDEDYETLGARGWFRDACGDSAYDLSGGCFEGSCGIGLNRLDVTTDANGRIIVDMRSGSAGLPRSENPPKPLSAPK